jgi:hypothetical protein
MLLAQDSTTKNMVRGNAKRRIGLQFLTIFANPACADAAFADAETTLAASVLN